MRNPLGRLKRRFGSAIQWRVDRSVDIRTAALMTTVHGLSVQLSESVASIADWRLEIEHSMARSAKTLDSIGRELSQMTDDFEKLRGEWSETLSELRAVLDEIDVEVQARKD